jgi:hypothetical protein
MKKLYLIALILLGLLTALSLARNGAIILALLQGRRIALNTTADTRAALADISRSTFSYTLEVSQDIPVKTSIPFNEEVIVPIQTTVPISTVVVVPINPPLLPAFNLSVPINTIVPVDLEIAVPISQTVDIATTVPLDVAVPVEIPIADTPLAGFLDELDAALARLEDRLTNPLESEGR